MDSDSLDRIARALAERQHGDSTPSEHPQLPDRESVADICRRSLAVLFPGFFTTLHLFSGHLDSYLRTHLLELETQLQKQALRAWRFQSDADHEVLVGRVRPALRSFFDQLPQIAERVMGDVEAAFRNDPAAKSRQEIIASYPGLEAIAVQRLAHELYRLGVPLLPRMMTETAHSRTGIDIHPGAQLGQRFAIDHGTGIVIGETCRIGDDCMLYHGVTLGAFNPLSKNEASELVRGQANKRHPDLEDHVTVYPGATILGGGTCIGHHSIIGGNVWLTRSVEPYSRVIIRDPDLVVSSRSPGQSAGLDWCI